MAVTSDLIYLDHNATTPVAPEVLEAMLPYLRQEFGNPSSSHPLGQRAAAAVAQARSQVAALIGAQADDIVFTSGGTESNNLAIRGTAAAADPSRRRIVTSNVEHPATTAPLAHLEGQGWTVTRLPVTPDGAIHPGPAVAAIGDDVALVTVMLAQNETGALQPVADLAPAAHQHGAVVHTDAAQTVGKIDVNVDHLGVDLLSIPGIGSRRGCSRRCRTGRWLPGGLLRELVAEAKASEQVLQSKVRTSLRSSDSSYYRQMPPPLSRPGFGAHLVV